MSNNYKVEVLATFLITGYDLIVTSTIQIISLK